MKSLPEGSSRICEQAEESSSKPKDKNGKYQSEEQKERRVNKPEGRPGHQADYHTCQVSPRVRRGKGEERISEKITAENLEM